MLAGTGRRKGKGAAAAAASVASRYPLPKAAATARSVPPAADRPAAAGAWAIKYWPGEVGSLRPPLSCTWGEGGELECGQQDGGGAMVKGVRGVKEVHPLTSRTCPY